MGSNSGGAGAGPAPDMPPTQMGGAPAMPLPGAAGPAPAMPPTQMGPAATMPLQAGLAPNKNFAQNHPNLMKALSGAGTGTAPSSGLAKSLQPRQGGGQSPQFALPPMTFVPPPVQQAQATAPPRMPGYTLQHDGKGNVTGLTTGSMGDTGGPGNAFYGR